MCKYLMVISSTILGLIIQSFDNTLNYGMFYVVAVNAIIAMEIAAIDELNPKKYNVAYISGILAGVMFIATLVTLNVLNVKALITAYGSLVLCISVSIAFNLYYNYLKEVNNNKDNLRLLGKYNKWFLLIGSSYLVTYMVASFGALISVDSGVIQVTISNNLLFYMSWVITLLFIPAGYVYNNLKIFR